MKLFYLLTRTVVCFATLITTFSAVVTGQSGSQMKLFEEINSGLPAIKNGKIAWADYDKDGRPDLAILGLGTGGNKLTRLYHNTASGFVDVSAQLLPNQDLFQVSDGMLAWGDYDGDGWIDLLVTGILNGTNNYNLRLYHNNGPSTMWSNTTAAVWNPVDLLQPNPPMMYGSAHWIEFFTRGRLDLFLFGQHYSGNQLLAARATIINNGGSNFSRTDDRFDGAVPYLRYSSADWADFDKDGKPDLIVIGEGTLTNVPSERQALFCKLFKGNPDGSGIHPVRYFDDVSSRLPSIPGLKNGSVAWGDYDNDTWPDLVISGLDGNNNYHTYIFHNQAGQSFADVSTQFPELPQLAYSSVGWGDYNKDGRQDLFVTGNIKTQLGDVPVAKLYFSNKNGGFTDESFLLPNLTAVNSGAVSWSDYDNDGLPDLMLTGDNGTGQPVLKLYRNRGRNTLFAQTTGLLPGLPGLRGTSVSWADYDSDGKLDFAIMGSESVAPTPLGGDSRNIGKLYHNTGNGFEDKTTLVNGLVNMGGGAIAWSDYNNDGKPDLFVTGGPNMIIGVNSKLFQNTGSGFTDVSTVFPNLPHLTSSSVAWGDYDNDGHADLIMAGLSTNNENRPVSKLYHNTGNGFEETPTSLLPNLPGISRGSVSWADYDRDGRLDLFISGITTNSAVSKLYHNTGSGFEDKSALLPGLLPAAYKTVSWGDYDNDGWLDVFMGGAGNNDEPYNQLYHNTGGGFEDKTALLPDVPAIAANGIWGDYDNDGKLDLVVASNLDGQSATLIYHNTGAGFENISLDGTGIPVVSLGSVSFADYDNDGKLDLLLTGDTGNGRVTSLLSNGSLQSNTKPGIPTGLTSQVLDGESSVKLSWQPATDAETPSAGLNYNLYVSDIPGGVHTVSPLADKGTGYRRIVQLGNSATTAFTLEGLQPDQTYYWSVQTIDGAFAGSAFSTEQYFRMSQLGDAEQPLKLITPLYNCGTGFLTFQTTGGDGTQIEYMSPGITHGWVRNPRQFVNAIMRRLAYRIPLVLWARQGRKKVTYKWNIRSACPVNGGGVGNPQTLNFEDVSDLLSNLPALQSPAIAWGDYDNDGKIDLMITGKADVPLSRLYRNTGNSFEDKSDQLPGLPQVSNGAIAWSDYDNDGRLDLMLTGVTETNGAVSGYITRLYHNTGNGFEDKTNLIPGQPQAGNGSVAWSDYDNDGRADFLLTGKTASGLISKLYHNTGTGFEDKTNLIPGIPAVQLSAAAFGDYDNDGRADLMLTGIIQSNNNPYISRLYHNTGSGFEDVSTDELPDLVGMAAGSVQWSDFDNDGRLDLLLTGTNGGTRYTTRLYHNTTYGFEDDSHFAGIYFSAAAFADFDNDGLKDLIFTGATTAGYSSKLYRNTGRNFTDVSALVPDLPQIATSAVGWADYDNDGKLDLLMTGYTVSGSVLKLYHNTSPTANTSPVSPTGLNSLVSNGSVQLNWNLSTDAQTPQPGLQYNIYVSDVPGAVNTLSPLADNTTGYRRVVQLGNCQVPGFSITGLQPAKTYYWSVQAIDGAFAGSPFATEQQFTTSANVGQPPVTDPHCRLVVYPNPVTGSAKVQVRYGEDNYGWKTKTSSWKRYGVLTIINNLGQTVMQVQMTDNQVVLDLSRLRNGVYYIRYNDDKHTVTEKIIKQ